MALIKIYTKSEKHDELISSIAKAIKLVTAAALNVPELPTSPEGIETVFVEGIDLVGIDYILEIIAVERPNQQAIAESIIEGLNAVYPKVLFSVYFVNISEIGMANTPRQISIGSPITMTEAIERTTNEI